MFALTFGVTFNVHTFSIILQAHVVILYLADFIFSSSFCVDLIFTRIIIFYRIIFLFSAIIRPSNPCIFGLNGLVPRPLRLHAWIFRTHACFQHASMGLAGPYMCPMGTYMCLAGTCTAPQHGANACAHIFWGMAAMRLRRMCACGTLQPSAARQRSCHTPALRAGVFMLTLVLFTCTCQTGEAWQVPGPKGQCAEGTHVRTVRTTCAHTCIRPKAVYTCTYMRT